MLVLTRKAGEKIQLGHDVTVTVLDVGGGRVRIGIDGEPWITIRRGKLPAAEHPPQGRGELTGEDATVTTSC